MLSLQSSSRPACSTTGARSFPVARASARSPLRCLRGTNAARDRAEHAPSASFSSPSPSRSTRPSSFATMATSAASAAAAATVDPADLPAAISAPDLADLLQKNDRIVVLDGSWFMPNVGRDGRAEFISGPRIVGSKFFDVARVCDTSSSLPHMLPSASAFAAAADALGITSPETPVVVYDRAGIFSAPRVWWTFRVFGHKNISVLDGGLPAWQAGGFPLEEGALTGDAAAVAAAVDAASLAVAAESTASPPPSSSSSSSSSHKYPASLQKNLVRDLASIREIVAASASGGKRESSAAALADARSAGRFEGTAPEPRPGLPSGHIPGSRSCPYDSVLDPETKTKLRELGEVRSILEEKAGFGEKKKSSTAADGVDDDVAVATCGTGVTASVLAWSAAACGLRSDVAVYDGSWSEWGSLEDTPKATGKE